MDLAERVLTTPGVAPGSRQGDREAFRMTSGGRPFGTWSGPTRRDAWLMKLSADKSRSVFDRHNIVSDTDLRDAARRLEPAILSPGGARGQALPRE